MKLAHCSSSLSVILLFILLCLSATNTSSSITDETPPPSPLSIPAQAEQSQDQTKSSLSIPQAEQAQDQIKRDRIKAEEEEMRIMIEDAERRRNEKAKLAVDAEEVKKFKEVERERVRVEEDAKAIAKKKVEDGEIVRLNEVARLKAEDEADKEKIRLDNEARAKAEVEEESRHKEEERLALEAKAKVKADAERVAEEERLKLEEEIRHKEEEKLALEAKDNADAERIEADRVEKARLDEAARVEAAAAAAAEEIDAGAKLEDERIAENERLEAAAAATKLEEEERNAKIEAGRALELVKFEEERVAEAERLGELARLEAVKVEAARIAEVARIEEEERKNEEDRLEQIKTEAANVALAATKAEETRIEGERLTIEAIHKAEATEQKAREALTLKLKQEKDMATAAAIEAENEIKVGNDKVKDERDRKERLDASQEGDDRIRALERSNAIEKNKEVELSYDSFINDIESVNILKKQSLDDAMSVILNVERSAESDVSSASIVSSLKLVDNLIVNEANALNTSRSEWSAYISTSANTHKQSLENELLELQNEVDNVNLAVSNAANLSSSVKDAQDESKDSRKEGKLAFIDSLKLKLKTVMDKTVESIQSMRLSADSEYLTSAIIAARSKEPSADSALLKQDTWKNAGFNMLSLLSPTVALTAIRNLPLVTYQLKDDTSAEQIVHTTSSSGALNQLRTRRHVGIIDVDSVGVWMTEADDAGTIDSSVVFNYNLLAVKSLSDLVEVFEGKINALIMSPQGSAVVAEERLGVVERIVKRGVTNATQANSTEAETAEEVWKSFHQTSEETFASEAEASISHMEYILHSIKSSTALHILTSKSLSRLMVLDENSLSVVRMSESEIIVETQRDDNLLQYELELDIKIIEMETYGKVITSKNDTYLELSRIRESSIGAGDRVRDTIKAEALLEREMEVANIERIRVIGEEATKAVVEIIKVTATNIKDAVMYTINTVEGKKQALLAIMSVSALAFCIVLTRELSSLIFGIIKKVLMTPKLIRSYGCSSSEPDLAKVFNNSLIFPAVLTSRLKSICLQTYLSKKRGSPLRNILIHGPPGCGKSSLSLALASGMGNSMPFALMAGSDLAPLGRHGPGELRGVLEWGGRGVVLIVDEAEAALGRRLRDADESDNLNEDNGAQTGYARDCLNVLLSLTGTETTSLMLILTTSNPDSLDEAVLDRMDEVIELKLPGEGERLSILLGAFEGRFLWNADDATNSTGINVKISFWRRMYNHLFLPKPPYKATVAQSFHPNVSKSLQNLALNANTAGCSGRELGKMMSSVLASVYADSDSSGDSSSGDGCLTEKMFTKVTQEYCNALMGKWRLNEGIEGGKKVRRRKKKKKNVSVPLPQSSVAGNGDGDDVPRRISHKSEDERPEVTGSPLAKKKS